MGEINPLSAPPSLPALRHPSPAPAIRFPSREIAGAPLLPMRRRLFRRGPGSFRWPGAAIPSWGWLAHVLSGIIVGRSHFWCDSDPPVLGGVLPCADTAANAKKYSSGIFVSAFLQKRLLGAINRTGRTQGQRCSRPFSISLSFRPSCKSNFRFTLLKYLFQTSPLTCRDLKESLFRDRLPGGRGWRWSLNCFLSQNTSAVIDGYGVRD